MALLGDPLTAIGAAAIVFFLLLGVLYLWDPQIPRKVGFGILFVLTAIVILLLLVTEPGLGGLVIAAIAALVAKNLLERSGVGA